MSDKKKDKANRPSYFNLKEVCEKTLNDMQLEQKCLMALVAQTAQERQIARYERKFSYTQDEIRSEFNKIKKVNNIKLTLNSDIEFLMNQMLDCLVTFEKDGKEHCIRLISSAYIDHKNQTLGFWFNEHLAKTLSKTHKHLDNILNIKTK